VLERVTALRTRHLRTRKRAARAASSGGGSSRAWAGGGLDLDREIRVLEIEIDIAEAQLDLDAARDPEAFDAAVARQIDAYRALAASYRTAGETDALVESLRIGVRTAAARLERYRALSTQVSESLKPGVLVALDDLDRAETDLRTAARTRTEGGPRWG
jgi:hypothetical protein